MTYFTIFYSLNGKNYSATLRGPNAGWAVSAFETMCMASVRVLGVEVAA